MSDIIPSNALAYLGTPYTDYPGGIELAFIDAAKLAGLLLRAGIKVYSPIVHGHAIAIHGGIDPRDRTIWLPFNEATMRASDVLIVGRLPTWDTSKGLAHEIEYFTNARKPIFDLDPVTLTSAKRKPLVPA